MTLNLSIFCFGSLSAMRIKIDISFKIDIGHWVTYISGHIQIIISWFSHQESTYFCKYKMSSEKTYLLGFSALLNQCLLKIDKFAIISSLQQMYSAIQFILCFSFLE